MVELALLSELVLLFELAASFALAAPIVPDHSVQGDSAAAVSHIVGVGSAQALAVHVVNLAAAWAPGSTVGTVAVAP